MYVRTHVRICFISNFLFIYFSFIYINLYYILTSYVNNKRVINIYKFFYFFSLLIFFWYFSFINPFFYPLGITGNQQSPITPNHCIHIHTRTYIHTHTSIPSNHHQIDFPQLDIHTQMPCKALFSLIQRISPLHLYQCPPKEK